MHYKRLNTPLVIEKSVLDSGYSFLGTNSYHEWLIFSSGEGSIEIGEAKISYESGDVFLIDKGRDYKIEVVNSSCCYQIKITEKMRQKFRLMTIELSSIALSPLKMKSSMHLKCSLIRSDLDIVLQIIHVLQGMTNNFAVNIQIIGLEMLALIRVIERNLHFYPGSDDDLVADDLMKRILKYIQKNLRNPENLKLPVIAANFYLTSNKLGSYFKSKSRYTVKQYIIMSRMLTISQLIRVTKRSFSELAFEFGFFDETHFTKAFKAYFHQTPSDFRKSLNKKE